MKQKYYIKFHAVNTWYIHQKDQKSKFKNSTEKNGWTKCTKIKTNYIKSIKFPPKHDGNTDGHL